MSHCTSNFRCSGEGSAISSILTVRRSEPVIGKAARFAQFVRNQNKKGVRSYKHFAAPRLLSTDFRRVHGRAWGLNLLWPQNLLLSIFVYYFQEIAQPAICI